MHDPCNHQADTYQGWRHKASFRPAAPDAHTNTIISLKTGQQTQFVGQKVAVWYMIN